MSIRLSPQSETALEAYLRGQVNEHAQQRQAGMQEIFGVQCCPLEPASQLWRILLQVGQRNPATPPCCLKQQCHAQNGRGIAAYVCDTALLLFGVLQDG